MDEITRTIPMTSPPPLPATFLPPPTQEPTPPALTMLPYAATDDTRWWRRVVVALAVYCIVFASCDLIVGGIQVWNLLRPTGTFGSPAFWYEDLLGREFARLTAFALGGGILLSAATVALGSVACLSRRDWRTLLLIAAFVTLVIQAASWGLQVFGMFAPANRARFGFSPDYLVYMTCASVKTLATPGVVVLLLFSQRLNPSLAATFR